MRSIFVIVLFISSFGCGSTLSEEDASVPSDSSNSSDAQELEDTAEADGVELTLVSANDATQTELLGRAGIRQRFVFTRVEIVNLGEEAISVAPSSFRVRTRDGLEFQSDEEANATIVEICPSDALLAPGARIECEIAFRISVSHVPEALVLESERRGRLVTESTPFMPFEECALCDAQCMGQFGGRYLAVTTPNPDGCILPDGSTLECEATYEGSDMMRIDCGQLAVNCTLDGCACSGEVASFAGMGTVDFATRTVDVTFSLNGENHCTGSFVVNEGE